jgi:hypothetical protein
MPFWLVIRFSADLVHLWFAHWKSPWNESKISISIEIMKLVVRKRELQKESILVLIQMSSVYYCSLIWIGYYHHVINAKQNGWSYAFSITVIVIVSLKFAILVFNGKHYALQLESGRSLFSYQLIFFSLNRWYMHVFFKKMPDVTFEVTSRAIPVPLCV